MEVNIKSVGLDNFKNLNGKKKKWFIIALRGYLFEVGACSVKTVIACFLNKIIKARH